jgi:hypothetical protein
LRKGVVVSLLQRSCCGTRSVAADERTAGQTDSGAYCCALMAAEQGARGSADGRADDSAFHRVVGRRLLCSLSADLRVRVAAAILLIEAELVEALPGSRKDENAGAAGRNRRATSDEYGYCYKTNPHFAGGGAGGTRCQPLGHSFT